MTNPTRHGQEDVLMEQWFEALATETLAYRRLLRLARRQNRYMRRQDTPRLESNGLEWSRYLPQADDLRNERTSLQNRLLRDLELDRGDGSPRVMKACLPPRMHGRFQRGIAEWAEIVRALDRQNTLNGLLVKFCLETIGEEARIFRNVITGQDGGCYGDKGTVTNRCNKGVVSQQA